MTTIYIPTIGTRLKLLAPWSFELIEEYRNNAFVAQCGFYDDGTAAKVVIDQIHRIAGFERIENIRDAVDVLERQSRSKNHREISFNEIITAAKKIKFPFTLPEDTILVVDRVYIRQGMSDYDSVTFQVEHAPDGTFANTPKKKAAFGRKSRFWVNLPMVNGMEVEVLAGK